MGKATNILEGYGDNYSVSLSATGSWQISLKIPTKTTDMIHFRDIVDGISKDKQDDMLDELDDSMKKLEKRADKDIKELSDAVEIMLESVAIKYSDVVKDLVSEYRKKYGA